MRVSLKSVMQLAHSLKRSRRIGMADALRLAWARAKGFTDVAEVSIMTAAGAFKRVYLFGVSAVEVKVKRITLTNEIARERIANSFRNCRAVLGSSDFELAA
jgi:hypothetical protein